MSGTRGIHSEETECCCDEKSSAGNDNCEDGACNIGGENGTYNDGGIVGNSGPDRNLKPRP